MKPLDFPERNIVWTGEGDTGNLPVFRDRELNISKWEISDEELAGNHGDQSHLAVCLGRQASSS